MMADYTDLIARLEKATEGGMALDEAIVRALYPDAIISIYCAGDDIPVVFHAEPLVPNKRDLPAFTTSLDAALTLVPGSHEWSVGVDLENRKGWARVADDIWDECCEDIVSVAPTIPLALVIAALKARQAGE
jgi:hypothetical protein